MTTYPLRHKLLSIARRDSGKVEETKNQAPWIKKLWPSTNYPEGYANREPYCAAGVCYCVQQWLLIEEVRSALGLTVEGAERWRCKSAAVSEWVKWAKRTKGVQVLSKNCILHAGDIVVYDYSHIEFVTDDDNTESGPFVAIGYNTNASGSRDGEGCFEKPRPRKRVLCIIRMLP